MDPNVKKIIECVDLEKSSLSISEDDYWEIREVLLDIESNIDNDDIHITFDASLEVVDINVVNSLSSVDLKGKFWKDTLSYCSLRCVVGCANDVHSATSSILFTMFALDSEEAVYLRKMLNAMLL